MTPEEIEVALKQNSEEREKLLQKRRVWSEINGLTIAKNDTLSDGNAIVNTCNHCISYASRSPLESTRLRFQQCLETFIDREIELLKRKIEEM